MTTPSSRRTFKLTPMEWGIGLASCAAVAVLIWIYFYFTVEEEYHINKGPIREAKNNPYYAVQKFLENEGLASTILHSNTVLGNLRAGEDTIGPRDAIVLIQGRGVIHQKRFETLWPWVEQGGKLITSMINPYFGQDHEEDALYKELGIQGDNWSFRAFYDGETDEEFPFEEAGNEESPFAPYGNDAEQKDESDNAPSYLEIFSFRCFGADVFVEGMGEENEKIALQSAWGSDFDIAGEYEASSFAKNESGYTFASFNIGKGRIAVNGDNSIWANRKVACQDHAWFLKLLVGDADHVWFVINNEAPSFFNLVWKGVPLAVLAFAFALVLMLWRTLQRFGPVYPDARIERRHFSEHIQAAANFLYRVGIESELVENLRSQIARSMQRKNRNFDELDKQQQLLSLEKHSALSLKEIEFAYLSPLDNLSKKEFILMVKTLKALKEQL